MTERYNYPLVPDGTLIVDVQVDEKKYPRFAAFQEGFESGYREGLKDGNRDAVQSGSVPERDDCGEDRDAEHRDDPPASPDPEKGPDESPKAETEGATIEWKLNRTLDRIQEQYGVGPVLCVAYMSEGDFRELVQNYKEPWMEGHHQLVIWHFHFWRFEVKIDPQAELGEVTLYFGDGTIVEASFLNKVLLETCPT